METHGGHIIADVLQSHGVRHLFTLCGGHISPILVGAKARGIRVIDMRGEAGAVFAADALARLTGRPGVAAVTAGPGVTNALTALKNAQMAQSPLVLLGGAAATIIKGRGSLQDIDQIGLVKSIVKVALTINRNCDIVPVLAHAFRVARSDVPGPVFVECPIDLLYAETEVRRWYGGARDGAAETKGLKSKLFQFYLQRHLDRMFVCDFDDMPPLLEPVEAPELPAAKVDKAARLLGAARRPVLIVGSQALLQPESTRRLADAVTRIGAPVYLTGMARGLLGVDHPLQMRHHRKKALAAADLVLLAGMPCDFRLNYGRAIPSAATLIAANRDKAALTLNRRPTLALHADPGDFLCVLSEERPLEDIAAPWSEWTATLRRADQEREDEIAALADRPAAQGVNPIAFFNRLENFLDERATLVADGGDFVATAAYVLRPRGPLRWLDPGPFGTLGVGAGFAAGAQLVRPGEEVWLLYGDGAAGYSLQEMDTFVRHGLPIIAVVGNDAAWAQIARDQVKLLEDDVATTLRRSDYHIVARGFGAKGLLVRTREEIDPALAQAREFARKGMPVLINVWLGPTDFREGSISM
ncbi:thiamine pyrophosphate-binding protein [Desulfatitalea alkaliphila]|uniref:Thiamine pyrophosphate-binding protein n=1 Tax=Desulfatitalea alkaliphila TaxID=2929485 RepID=A0AA41QZR5_9BACT|nr:thiamine pyrophosphate-binding protein [Desulfatitalea alkaliphila]MCJ8499402.1 thiamine pyrophosphate-binding protein [Desulfatitalea alkaliphila]